MNYNQALDYIHNTLKFGMKPGLERVKKLLELLGNPQDKLKFIHIAGTNGKGSISTTLSAIYTKAGYKTGLFISPFVTEWCERIQINCENLPRTELPKLVEKIIPCVKKIKESGEDVTEFEIVTAIAMLWYAQNNCDIVILEVGLGGRFDATNVIKNPLACVIAKIDLDHTAILGDTLDKIAFEKCGIFKKSAFAVSYPLQEQLAKDTIIDNAKRVGIELIIPNLVGLYTKQISLFGSDFEYNSHRYHLKLVGEHQIYNAITALTVIEKLNKSKILPVNEKDIDFGLANVIHPARLEVISKQPLIILDGAHNPSGALSLRKMLDSVNIKGKKYCIMGMLGDKDFETAVKTVAPYFDEIFTLTPNNPRALPAEKLAIVLEKYCDKVTSCNDLTKCVENVKGQLTDNDMLVCWGSLYLDGELRPLLF